MSSIRNWFADSPKAQQPACSDDTSNDMRTEIKAVTLGSEDARSCCTRRASTGSTPDDSQASPPFTLSMDATSTPVIPLMSGVLQHGTDLQIADGLAFGALVHTHDLIELRSFESFAYSAHLFHHGPSLTWFVALHQNGALWDVYMSSDMDVANDAFVHLEEEAARLSCVEAQRAMLIAQNADLARQIREAESQAASLRLDLTRLATQERLAHDGQQRERKELARLKAQQIAALASLNQTHRAVRQLQMTANENIPRMLTREMQGGREFSGRDLVGRDQIVRRVRK